MWLKQSTSVTVRIGPVIDTSNVADTGLLVTDIALTKNGTTAALTVETFAAASGGAAFAGYYDLTLSAGNTDTLGRLSIRCAKASRRMEAERFMVLPAATYDALTTNAAAVTRAVQLNNLTFLMSNASVPQTGKTVSAQVSKDGGAFVACANAVSEIANGIYKITLTAAEMTAAVVTLRFFATGCEDRFLTITTQTT